MPGPLGVPFGRPRCSALPSPCPLSHLRRERGQEGRSAISRDRPQHSAVDVVGRADAVAGLVGAQEDEEARDLLGRGEALDGGVLGGDVGDVVLPGPIAAGRQLGRGLDPVGGEDEPEVERVDADVMGDQLVGEVLGEHDERRLGRVVDRLLPERLGGADRGVVEDDAAAAADHRGSEAAGEADGGHDVQVPVVLPLRVGGLEDGLVAAGAGVVDQDVGPAEGGLGGGDDGSAALSGGEVGLDGAGLDGVLAGDGGGLAIGTGAVAGGEEQVDAFRGEAAGDGESDADAAAGDDGDLAAQAQIHAASPAGHFTTGILLRSMVAATARVSTAPKTICCAKMLTPTKVMPTRTTEMMSEPTSVRQTLPTPPVIAVPPTTTAAMAGSSSSLARVGEPLARRPARMTPAKPAKAAESVKAITFCRSTLTPDA